jgi:type II restriction/modification system DNA methylase subunit YeeA
VSAILESLNRFVDYAKTLAGDEKGEAQVFCDRLFQAFGHAGYKEAGATLEFRIKKESGRGTQFADLVWKPRLLLEMKKGGEKLHLHYRQAFDYWINAVPNRPRYVVLSNFRDFWIYDFDKQLDEPVDTLSIDELPKRYTALNFLFPEDRKPIFNNDREGVSRKAADQMADLFRHLFRRPGNSVSRTQAQRFVLQTVVAMFAEDIDLLPLGTVQSLVVDCLEHEQSAYDLFGDLFRQMNNATPASGGRFKGVRYFNGGLFSATEPIDLRRSELELIGGTDGAATKDWSKVNPAIFGTLFQHSMEEKERHALGAHFTSEADIQRIVGPTIVTPWRERIDAARSTSELFALRRELMNFRVLDPACGSGNFLYVSFRELARLDLRILARLQQLIPKEFAARARPFSIVTPKQFFGLDIDPFGVELAKVTLMLAKKLSMDEAMLALGLDQHDMALGGADALPLDNLDENIRCADALFSPWPEVEAIVGNPPYQSKNKIQSEMDRGYINRLRERYPDIDGRADYCVYWFRRAHDHLKPGQRAGLVGTNTIRQNYSREGGLDYIVANGGTITEAVSSMIWPGEAVVHVSIANWIKGEHKGKKRLYIQEGNDPTTGWRHADFDKIGPSLSFELDVSSAMRIEANAAHGGCFQGQTHGHKGFLVQPHDAKLRIAEHPEYAEVLFPFLIADDLIGERDAKPTRYVIDFQGKDIVEAQRYGDLFARIQRAVLPDRQKAAENEEARNKSVLDENPKAKVNSHHANFLRKWWVLSYAREDLIRALSRLPRYIVCGRVTKRPIFEFVDVRIRPNDALQVFPYADDYSFGILQSDTHWSWFVARCSTLKSDFRYTSNTVFDSFPWPQAPSEKAVKRVADAAVALRTRRNELRASHNLSFRELYRSLELPGDHPLKVAHSILDEAVRSAYGMTKDADSLAFLLNLNAQVASAEADGQEVQGPGLPDLIKSDEAYITDDCVEP